MKVWRLFPMVLGMVLVWGTGLDAQEIAWRIKAHDDPGRFKSEIAEMANQGYVPTGLSFRDGGILVLYIKTPMLTIDGWRFASYQTREALDSGITSLMKKGYVPSGLSYTGRFFFVIFIKKRHSATDWRLVSSPGETGRVVETVECFARQGFFPVGITAHAGQYYVLFIKTRGREIESWVIRTNHRDETLIREDVDHLIHRGFLPWGLLWGDRQVHMLYGGLVPYKMMD